jgi:putative endonuclease
MHFVYILKSHAVGKLYIGYSTDLVRRLDEHNKGLSLATKPYKPWKTVYYEAYVSRNEAKRREHNLKLRSNAWNQLKSRINESLNSD